MQSNHVSHFWSTQPHPPCVNRLDHEASRSGLHNHHPQLRVCQQGPAALQQLCQANWALCTSLMARWGLGTGKGHRWQLWHQSPAPWGSPLLAGVHSDLGLPLPALLCYLCGFASCLQSQSTTSSLNCKLRMYLRMGYVILKEPARPPEDLRMPFGLSNMTTTCCREIVFQQFNDVAESLQIKRFWFGFHIKAKRGS